MKNNKKGLSTIVATLLIILLTLVAVGIIWIVVRNVVQGGTDQIEIDSKCLAANVEATQVDYTAPAATMVTIYRNGGNDPLAGVKIVFTERTGGGNNVVETWALDGAALHAPLDALESREIGPFDLSGMSDPSAVGVAVYFKDSSGQEKICSTANALTFR